MRRLLPPPRSFLGTGSQIGSIVRVLSHSIWSWVRQWRYKTGSADCLCWHFIFKSRQLVLFECFIFVNILFYILTYLKILFVCWSGCINEISISWYEKKEKFDVLFSPQIVCKCNRPCRFIQWEQKY